MDDKGNYVRANVKRRDLRLAHFHSMRHGDAMDCDDAEEALDLLWHKNSIVTRSIYRAHFSDRRREQLRARMEARPETRTETASGDERQQLDGPKGAEVADLQAARRVAKRS